MSVTDIIHQLQKEQNLDDADFLALLRADPSVDELLFACAREVREKHYGKSIYIRGLIEVSNICRNDCYYCGIRCGNPHLERYRLTAEDILESARIGHALGFRTFVLQGGEDPGLTRDTICSVISTITKQYPDSAVTLSLGEKPHADYQAFFDAGATRYLLRHESANAAHYAMLHPERQRLEDRIACLYDLKAIGYQVGAGFMVGTPGETDEILLENIRFMQKLNPAMIGIGPFLPQHDTPFADKKPGTVSATLRLLAILRLTFPYALIPATTALASLSEDGRIRGILAGCNVIMPNLSPADVRSLYALYDNKASFGTEAAESISMLRNLVASIGYEVEITRGDVKRGSAS